MRYLNAKASNLARQFSDLPRSKIDKVPLEQKGWNAVQQPIQTGTKCGLVWFWKFMFNAMLMKSILMFDFKNDHDLIGIHLSLDVCSR